MMNDGRWKMEDGRWKMEVWHVILRGAYGTKDLPPIT
jgi:hypothetical protein